MCFHITINTNDCTFSITTTTLISVHLIGYTITVFKHLYNYDHHLIKLIISITIIIVLIILIIPSTLTLTTFH